MRDAEDEFEFEDQDEETWRGIEDDEDNENGNPAKVEVVDHEEQYIDEDRYTTVTIEEVDVSKEGLKRAVDDDESDEPDVKAPKLVEKEETKKKVWPKKERKKKFTYETRAERKLARGKQKASRMAKAEARKGTS